MALTQFDAKTALIIIDLQKGIVAYPTAHAAGEVIRRAGTLVAAFRGHRLPIVFVNVAGGAPGRTEQARRTIDFPEDWTELVSDLDARPKDHRVTKMTWGAFTNTDLEAYLRAEGVTQVVLAGIATSIGVESTARFAYELGLNVTLAVDAMTDMNADAHTNSVTRIFPRLGETGSTAEIVALLAQGRS